MLAVTASGEVEVLARSVWSTAANGWLARYGKRTRQSYAAPLRRWAAFCAAHHIDPATASRAQIETWARWLSERERLHDHTISGYLTAVCGVYRYAHRDGLIPTDPGAYVDRPRCPRISTTNGLSRTEAQRVLALAHAHDDVMTAALVCLLLLNGMRLGETLGVDIEHLGEHDQWTTAYLPRRKGGGVATLSLSATTAAAVEAARGERMHGPLLLGPWRVGRMDSHTAQDRVRALAKAAGVTRRITPHSLRHTFITLALDAGVRERDIMASSGHNDPSMIVYYDRARAAIERNATHAVTDWIASTDSPPQPEPLA